MSKRGFVYLLGNKAMPCYYKIGCTSTNPHQRADQLSAASGVPVPFSVLLFVSMDNFQREERWLHSQLADFRPSLHREFFLFRPSQLAWVRAVFKDHPRALEYVECELDQFAGGYGFEECPWIQDQNAEDGLYLSGCAQAPLEAWELERLA